VRRLSTISPEFTVEGRALSQGAHRGDAGRGTQAAMRATGRLTSVIGEHSPMPAEPAAVTDAPTEREIVDRARAGDRLALGDIYDLYVTPIYRYVLAHVGNPSEAEDITEEVFLRVVEHVHRFEWRDVPFSAWIFRIAKNQLISHVRKHGNRLSGIADGLDVEDSRPGPERLVEHTLTMREVFQACEKLPPLQRQIIALRFGAGLSVRETAETLGKTENNVKVLQHKAIAKLQKLLGVR
jgi:RNA polymerase sigma-70 factor (ECF subfamily)